jgi:FAD/FMN-containing dehydrogenase
MADDASPRISDPPIKDGVLDRLKAVVGEGGWSQDADRLAPKLVEWRDRWSGTTPLLLLPKTVEQVSAIVRLCAETRTPITPQGGNTGLVGGQIPQGEVLLSLEKMSAIREVNVEDDVIVAEAGATLAAAHEAATGAGRFFPLSLASEGSCTIGGLISTNAGGTAVLRYGTMRALVLGIEAVLPNGDIHHGLKRLRKDNTGYDLKQLLIGAEGTLGVVTAASLKLFPILADRTVAMVAVRSPKDAITLLGRAKAESGGAVEAFELMSRAGVAFAIKNLPGLREPLAEPSPWTVLIEMAGAEPGRTSAAMERLLAAALDKGLIQDAAIAQNEAQAKAFWNLREGQSAAQKPEGAAWKHDVATPVSRIADFIEEATAAVTAFAPGVRVVAFGHVGDGNIHFDVIKPENSDDAPHNALRDQGARIVHDIAMTYEGSISAEHGLGTMKSAEALRYKAPQDVAAMRAIRAALDPNRIMNPRVLF